MKRTILASGLLVAALTLAACGGTTDDAEIGDGPATGTCLEGTPDCDDTGILDDPDHGQRCLPEAVGCDDTPGRAEPVGDVYDDEAAITQAQSLLGLAEPELGPDVRVGRRGEDQQMLTDDYVLGRMTVELDLDDMDAWIVTAVTVELADAPRTFTRYLT